MTLAKPTPGHTFGCTCHFSLGPAISVAFAISLASKEEQILLKFIRTLTLGNSIILLLGGHTYFLSFISVLFEEMLTK